MRNTIWISVALFVVGTMAGCGSKEKPTDSAKPATEASQTTTSTAAETPVVVASGTPEEAVNSFLNALQTGDEKAAAALLTTKAREETAKHDMVVEPPGAPNATYSVGRVQHPNEDPDAAYVSCVWSEKHEDGQADSYEVVWVMRRESIGWRVAGMATQLGESEEPVFLDFEDLAAMEDTVQKAETAASTASAAGASGAVGATAAQPQDAANPVR
jgi:hypothetical protein